MNKFTSIAMALLLAAQLFNACRSAKPSSSTAPVGSSSRQNANTCGQTIKYLCSKGTFVNIGKEERVNMELIFNPSEKQISVSLDSPEGNKRTITATIESLDCHFSAGLKSGYATYEGMGKKPGAPDIEVMFRIEAHEEGLTIRQTMKGIDEAFLITVDSWEIVASNQ